MESAVSSLLVALFLGYALEYAQMATCAPNYGTQWNGYGQIDLVNQRAGGNYPTLYRVLVPWLIWVLEKLFPGVRRVNWYEAIKAILNAGAIWAVWRAWDFETAAVFCILLLLTFKFDYWDWASEVIGISLAMTGDLRLAVVGVVIHGLSRETALIAPVGYVWMTGDWIGGAGLLALAGTVLLAVHLWKDKGRLLRVVTVGRMYFLRLTWEKIRQMNAYYPMAFGDMFIAMVYSGIILVAVLQFPAGWIIPAGLLAAGWLLAQPEEVRIFSACLPWVAAMIVRWIG